jgi:D-alanyl-D-alanine carboxypeptidase/D-alanyl-D-alanine-endopeptidase (penicillin-binding protein 4)
MEAIIQGPDYRQAHWGILVVDAGTGKTVFAHDPDKLFDPASVAKLYSCSTALAIFGPDYRFETPVYRRGPVENGRLRGDLILVAQGDLTLGGRTLPDGHMAFRDVDHTYANGCHNAELTETDPLAGLKSLARQVAKSGIHRVEGDVLIDDRLFEQSRGGGTGPDILTPIVVNDNVLDVIVKPAAEIGEPASVGIRPDTIPLHIDAEVTTSQKGKQIDVQVSTGSNGLTVRGQIPLGARPLVRIYAVGDPTGFARDLFVECLRHEGVTLAPSPSVFRGLKAELPERGSYDGLTRVALYTSPPFSETIKVTLKVSHNLYADILPLLVAVKNNKRTLNEGLRLQGQFLARLGVDVDTISLDSGSGGGIGTLVTPRATVQLLLALSRRPDYRVFRAGLPIAGVDGTASQLVPKNSPVRGKVMAKGGGSWDYDPLNERWVSRCRALAGTMTTASARELVFAMFVNNVARPKGTQVDRDLRVLGQLCEILWDDRGERGPRSKEKADAAKAPP